MKLNRHQKKFIEKNKKYGVVSVTRVVDCKRNTNGLKTVYRAVETDYDMERSKFLRVTLENKAVHVLSLEFLESYDLKWVQK